MDKTIFEQFKHAYERDRPRYIKDWLVRWDYQVKRKKRKVIIDEGEPQDFFTYNGPSDLVEWMNWLKEPSPDYLGEAITKSLTDLSEENDRKVCQNLGININWNTYRKNIDLMNAHDYLFPNLYPQPARYKIRNILDFGAGYGRQANLWTSKLSDYTLVGMDAVPKSYCLQHIYYKALGKKMIDYCDVPDLKVDLTGNCIYHIPTWRYDLLPTASFDLVMCVQVLPEINSTLVKKMVVEFERILKPGGMLYIHDHGYKWKPGTQMNIDNYISQNGFVLEFRPHVIDNVDIHGFPRIYRKIDPAVIQSEKPSLKRIVRQQLENADALLGGRLSKLSRSIRNKQ